MFLLTIYLPWLLNMLPYSYWALTCLAVLPTYSAFMISVRQASDLPPASFRFPVTQDTLALGYILPAVGRIGDFHPLKHAPAGRTKKSPPNLFTIRRTFYFPIHKPRSAAISFAGPASGNHSGQVSRRTKLPALPPVWSSRTCRGSLSGSCPVFRN